MTGHSPPAMLVRMSMQGRSLGARIRHARVEKGWTQQQLATAVGTRERNVGRWEGDQNEPRLDAIAALARALDKPLEYFMNGTPA